MADWRIRSIFHFILPCSNVERSMDFYAHFGFKVAKDNRDVQWPDYVGDNFNMIPGAQGRAVQLVLPDADPLQTRIDLIEWIKPRWTNEEAHKPLEQRLPRVLALLTHNVQEAAKDLVAKGLKATNPVRARDPAIGVEGVICFEDPDGHIVELIEYFPGQLGSKSENLPKRNG